MSEVKVNKISPRSGTDVTLGDSGDTFTLPTGVTLDASNATTTLPANVVTTDGTQTLTNKSIAATQLTGTITPSDNTVSLAKLTATGTKDSTTFLRGDNTFAEAGGGKVLQVVQGVKTDTTVISSGFADTGITATITPSSTSSKILIMCQITCTAINNAGATVEAFLRLLRNTTAISQGDTAGSRTLVTTGVGGARDNSDSNNGVIIFLDSPATTSATTYKIQGTDRDLGSGAAALYINRSYTDSDATNRSRGTSNIVLMEIGA